MRPGDPAPELTRTAHNGKEVSLATLKGRWVVVYFYPADETPGCTAEACSFRDAHHDFLDAGAVVIGISADSDESHRRFARKHHLPFLLVSDEDGSIARSFGVRKSLGVLPARITFVIDPEGRIASAYSSQLRFGRHHEEALATIREGAVA